MPCCEFLQSFDVNFGLQPKTMVICTTCNFRIPSMYVCHLHGYKTSWFSEFVHNHPSSMTTFRCPCSSTTKSIEMYTFPLSLLDLKRIQKTYWSLVFCLHLLTCYTSPDKISNHSLLIYPLETSLQLVHFSSFLNVWSNECCERYHILLSHSLSLYFLFISYLSILRK